MKARITTFAHNIDKDAAEAVLSRRRFTRSYTKVRVDEDGTSHLYLYDNEIVRYTTNNDLYITMAGWPTRTTSRRLAAFPEVAIRRRGVKFVTVLTRDSIDDEWNLFLLGINDWLLHSNIVMDDTDAIVKLIMEVKHPDNVDIKGTLSE